MSSITFFTPTYRGDAERFKILRESVRRFYQGDANHVIAVPSEDEALFRGLTKGDNIEIVIQDDFVDSRFYQASWYSLIDRFWHNQAWRFARFAGRNGWIIHIIVKLSLCQFIKDQPAILLDSDSFFTREFSNSDLDNPDCQRVLVKWIPGVPKPAQERHLRRTREILGVPAAPELHNYQSHPEVWYPDWVERLQTHLELKYEKPWQHALFDAGTISSSALYGTFVEEVLKPADLMIRGRFPYFIAWDDTSYANFLRDPESSISDRFYAVIQSNLGYPAEEYRDLVYRSIFNV